MGGWARALLLIAAGIGCLVAAQRPSMTPPAAVTEVLVAAHAMPAGATLRAGDVGVAALGGGLNAADFFTEPAQVIGLRTVSGLAAGAPITRAVATTAETAAHRLVSVDTTAAGAGAGTSVDVVAAGADAPASVVATCAVVGQAPPAAAAAATELDCTPDGALAVVSAQATARTVRLLVRQP